MKGILRTRRAARTAHAGLDVARVHLARWLAWLAGDAPIEVVNAALLRRTRRVASLLAAFGAEVGDQAVVHGPLVIHNADPGYENLSIGRKAHVGRGVLLDLTRPIVIEEKATVSMGATILTHADVGDRPLAARYPREERETRIGSGAYVGANATILPGCHIGRRAVLGAGAVVTAPVPDGAVAVGIPARVVAAGGNLDEIDGLAQEPLLRWQQPQKAGREA
jgi:serine acetyltransferase